MKKSIIFFVFLFFLISTGAHASWDWKNSGDLLLWSSADTGFESIEGVVKWRDKSGNGNHMTVVGSPVVKENALNGHRAMELDSDSNEYFYVDFDEPYVGSSTIFIVGNMKSFKEYKGMFSTSTPNNKRYHNTFETYLLNNNIESASMNSSSGDINKDRQFNKEGFEFNKYKNYISRYENVEANGTWSATNLKTYYGTYNSDTDATSLDMVGNFGNRAYSSEARFNTYAGFSLGSRWNFTSETPDAEFAEVIIFKRALSEEEMTKVSEYISDKYFKTEGAQAESGFDIENNLSLWIKGESYPEDYDISGVLSLKDYSGKGKNLKLSHNEAVKYEPETVNNYGVYTVTEGGVASASENYSGDSTIFLTADIPSDGADGTVFSVGGIELVKNNGLQIITDSGVQSMDTPSGLSILAIRRRSDSDVVTVEGFCEGTLRTVAEYQTGGDAHSEYSLGGAELGLYELLVYQKALTDGEMLAVTQYLSGRYFEEIQITNTDYFYLDSEGEPCEVISESGRIKAEVTVKNTKPSTAAQLVLAVYKNGSLTDVSVSEKYSMQSGSETVFNSGEYLTLPDNLSGVSLKFMLVDGINGIKPLKNSYEWEFPIIYE